jgi:hypothetical protein
LALSTYLVRLASAWLRDDRLSIPRPAEAARRWPIAGAARGTLVALIVGSGLLAAAAPAAMAYGTPLSCTGRSEAKVFAPWGDTSNYFRVSNGGFEANGTDWALSGGATVVAGNESYKVAGTGDVKSLKIPAGAQAESRTLCVSMGEDSIRLFVNNPGVTGAILHVDAIVRNPTTGQMGYAAFDVIGNASPAGWAPTMRLGLQNMLNGSGTQELTLVFTTRGTPATWLVDDVFVDPFKSY